MFMHSLQLCMLVVFFFFFFSNEICIKDKCACTVGWFLFQLVAEITWCGFKC